ncbi:MAG: TonB-dependent receptor [Prolixibacteraceae bacterium]|nr:TonB-dependent receptor [Prolixibacteraceae bacterium]
MRTLSFIALLIFTCSLSYGQFKQNLRGVVVDQSSKVTLPGANVSLDGVENKSGTMTSENGTFIFKDLPIGRYTIKVSFLGYEPVVINNIDLVSGKEKVFTIELSEKVQKLDEVIVTSRRKGEVMNEMAVLSARSFTVQETEKYAGSWGDPSRMASNFAGVITANDSRNDIVIRGNSSLGLLWKIEGISVPNPNHFGALGSTGGPVSILNNNNLSNSDFFTGAFPAEYGNATAGVFDLKMRNGNNQKHEFTGQVGFGGFEFGAEGPLSKKSGSSYIINYRYSVLSLMDKLGFDMGGGVPEYQDLTMKLNFPTKKAGTFSLFAIGGLSNIVFEDTDSEGGTSYDTGNDSRTKNGSKMGVAGLTHRFFPDNKSNIYSTISASFQGVETQVDSVFDDLSYKRFFGEGHQEIRLSASTKYTRKFNPKNTLKAGISFESFSIDLQDSVDGAVYTPPLDYYVKSLNTQKNGLYLIQAFGELQHKFTDYLTLYTGIHSQYFLYNSTYSVDPRLSLSYQTKKGPKFSLAYGKHSQLQPLYVYFTEDFNEETGEYTQTNNNLKFTNAHHFVAGYDQMIAKNLKLKAETYYQYLTGIPVSKDIEIFSMANEGNSFNQARVPNLINEGLGRNYGVELTLEKYLSNNYYFLLTSSLFDSKYKGYDDVWRNTEFNTNFVVNALGGYQIPINEKTAIDINFRIVWSGGKRNYYIDLDKSNEASTEVYDYSKTYNEREKDYFRLDSRISFKLNGKKITQEWALDITNLTNHKNIYSRYYDNEKRSIEYVFQQGFYPMMLYRINF